MDTELKEQLIQVEGQIKELCPAKDDFDQLRMVANLSSKEKEHLVTLLRTRRCLLNRMLLGTPAEIARMREVNDRLIDLTKKLYEIRRIRYMRPFSRWVTTRSLTMIS